MDSPTPSRRPGTVLSVGGFTPLTGIDYPGELAAVVFCQGCPWRCRYCHNPGLIPTRPEHPASWPEILRFLEHRRGLLDAVVFSGGEPTRQTTLKRALGQVRAMGFKTGLHTAGPYPDRLQRLLPRLDWVGLDIKAPPDAYPAITGVTGSGQGAWESARRLIASGVAHEIRLTVHPALLSPADVQQVVVALRDLGARNLVLQSCRLEHTLDKALSSLGPTDPDDYRAIIQTHDWISLRA